ncbi:MAG: 2-oxoglutarate dehydrogenase complex dihydrolipoyllysine-residue succinyltransferase [Cellvibrionales bacterium]|nr:2-oxoglutarate dehydrogenase complex dihydrolipoyllysine-residue succinyltransferase [Cellvibrionales bacterium]
MSMEIKVPTLPESVSDATVAAWHKKVGERLSRDELLVEVETDKVVLEVPAPADGVLGQILAAEGAVVVADQVLGAISDAPVAADSEPETPAATPAESPTADAQSVPQTSPAVRKLLSQHEIDARQIAGSGKNGRILKEDVLRFLEDQDSSSAPEPAATPAAPPTAADSAAQSDQSNQSPPQPPALDLGERPAKRVPMTRIRARIAQRLLEATQTTAMLTTFNEVDMQPFMDFRARYQERFKASHGIKLGFMSVFVKAAAEALRRFPDINASIDGTDILYHGYCDIGVAVSTDDGLVVPILRDCEQMSVADIEKSVAQFAERARNKKLSLDELTGGTFTITNGGVFGSMLSTPILNPPQSAILGMHATQERAVVVAGEIVVRPMMYIALSYDHRIVDGKGAVSFLKTIKEFVEDPVRMLFDV